MNKIYIGDQEITTGGGGSSFNPSDYVDSSTFDAHEKVIASALVDLKSLGNKIEAFDADIQAQENALQAEIQTKADVSTVYTKKLIDKSDKVVAAALASLDGRVSSIETSIGSGGGGSAFDPTEINSSINDISTRVATIESDYATSDDLSTFITGNDVSKFITENDISTFVDEEDVSAYVRNFTYDKATIDTMVQSGGGGGSADLTNYYTKYQSDASLTNYAYSKSFIDASYGFIDTSVKALDASALSFDASIHTLDVSVRALDASVRELATSGGGGGSTPDLTNYATKSDISTFKPITYVNLSTYEDMVEEETIDEDTMYVITDLASSDDLATLVTVDDLSTYKQTILDDVSTTADTTIANANTSINSIKTTAISAVQSQQTTSVNAVNTAKNNANSSINTAKTNAISEISTYIDGRVAEMKNFVVISDASYNELQTIDSNTIYFITD